MKGTSKIIMLMLLVSPLLAAGDKFKLDAEPTNIFSPLRELGIDMVRALSDVIPIWVRQPIVSGVAGDYYRSPLGADTSALTVDEIAEVGRFLSQCVSPNYYDSFVTRNIVGYQYRLIGEDKNRRECFARYSQGDTIYVISGWLGKFLSFYRAVPGIIKYDLNGLRKNVSRIAADDIQIRQEAYDKSSHDNSYFIEYVNREKMPRVRCYHVAEEVGVDTTANRLITNPRTLIEITKFIDKEVMP